MTKWRKEKVQERSVMKQFSSVVFHEESVDQTREEHRGTGREILGKQGRSKSRRPEGKGSTRPSPKESSLISGKRT